MKLTTKDLNKIVSEGLSKTGIESGLTISFNDSDSALYIKRNIAKDFVWLDEFAKIDTSRIEFSYINRFLQIDVCDMEFFADWNVGELISLSQEFEMTDNPIVFSVSEPILFGKCQDSIYFEISQIWHSGRRDALWFEKSNGEWRLNRIENVYIN